VSKKKHGKHEAHFHAQMNSPQPSHVSHHGGNGHHGPAVKPYERLLKSGLVEIEALAFIRGRSIARRFFILDEAQQLTPHEVKTVITRISEGSKIVLIGDPSQIDNPYVDARSNGLVYCHNRMKGQGLAAHVKLTKGERSKLAELAADLL
jgi:PhoH-like ATPase